MSVLEVDKISISSQYGNSHSADFDLDKGAFSSLSKAWKYLGSPIGGTMGSFANRGAQSWSNMQYGHFGQNSPAYFTFGSYSPSEDFKLWSGVPLD